MIQEKDLLLKKERKIMFILRCLSSVRFIFSEKTAYFVWMLKLNQPISSLCAMPWKSFFFLAYAAEMDACW